MSGSPPGPPRQGPGALDVAAHYLRSGPGGLIGGDWYDAMELPDGRTLLTVGDLTGSGVPATSAMAMMLGALRGMAVAGIEPGALMGHLNQVLETSVQPTLGSALCCRFDPATSLLSWAQAGHPAPLLFRHGSGRPLPPPDGVLLGAASHVPYEQDEVRLFPGDVLVLHTAGLMRHDARGAGPEALLALAPGSHGPVRHRSASGASSRSSAGPNARTTRVCWSPASGREGARKRLDVREEVRGRRVRSRRPRTSSRPAASRVRSPRAGPGHRRARRTGR
ncbi:hypothetical protein SCALM49S_07645 [Streptomyces californicus]